MDAERQSYGAATAIPQEPGMLRALAGVPALIDVITGPAPPFRYRGWLFQVVVLALWAGGGLAARFFGAPIILAVAMNAALAVVLITAGVRYSLNLRRRSRLVDALVSSEADDRTLISDFAAMLRTEAIDLQEFARKLARRGRTITVRIHTGDAQPIEPFEVEFEPRPLNEADPGFRALALCADEIRDADERSPVRRNVSRAWRAGAIGISLYALAHVLYYAFESWHTQWLNPNLFVWLAFVIVAILFRFFHVTPEARPLIVPGGLVMRQPHWVAGKFGTKLYRAEDGVLIVYQAGRHQWAWVLGTRGGVESGTATENEARTLLRAWLSPLTPPSLERIRRLFEGGE